MSDDTARRILRAGLACKAVSLAARGAGWEKIGELLPLPEGVTTEQLRAAALAHLERERSR